MMSYYTLSYERFVGRTLFTVGTNTNPATRSTLFQADIDVGMNTREKEVDITEGEQHEVVTNANVLMKNIIYGNNET